MAATVQIIEKNGAGGTGTNKTSGTITFCNADSPTPGTSNPLIIPTAGTEYSYEKWTRLNVTVAPSTNISNLGFYTDGSNGFGTGVSLYAKAVTTYAQPAVGTGTTGYTEAFANYTSSSPLDLGTGTFTGTGEKGDHAVLLMTVGTSATPGQVTSETVTYVYDEI